jgi:hypothetical protein
MESGTWRTHKIPAKNTSVRAPVAPLALKCMAISCICSFLIAALAIGLTLFLFLHFAPGEKDMGTRDFTMTRSFVMPIAVGPSSLPRLQLAPAPDNILR